MQLFLSPLISLPESWNTWKRRKNSQITIWAFFYYFREKKNREYEGGIPSSTIAWLFFSTSKQYSVFPFTIFFLFVQQKLYLGKICKVSVLPNFGLQTGKVGNTVFGLQQLNFDIIKGRGKKVMSTGTGRSTKMAAVVGELNMWFGLLIFTVVCTMFFSMHGRSIALFTSSHAMQLQCTLKMCYMIFFPFFSSLKFFFSFFFLPWSFFSDFHRNVTISISINTKWNVYK